MKGTYRTEDRRRTTRKRALRAKPGGLGSPGLSNTSPKPSRPIPLLPREPARRLHRPGGPERSAVPSLRPGQASETRPSKAEAANPGAGVSQAAPSSRRLLEPEPGARSPALPCGALNEEGAHTAAARGRLGTRTHLQLNTASEDWISLSKLQDGNLDPKNLAADFSKLSFLPSKVGKPCGHTVRRQPPASGETSVARNHALP
ncbi:uncharacterized protein LOC112655444 isoform X1 [Canis lupus dingo]|uniref:uncharacterized protein LOC112655444 isoform X1 n=2 Tax=Canis lupus dingo TaxID=286419 RepID=UPI0020C42045|nr:uncharacterized protein LOC112655444 isoform X1 [Canis lupus dingo]